MTKRFSVGHLLELSQFAENFYPLVHGLSGRDIIYKNPGTSLRSFAIANSYQRLLDLDKHMEESYDECVSFLHDPEVRAQVEAAMLNQPYEMLNKIEKVCDSPDQVATAAKNLDAIKERLRIQIDLMTIRDDDDKYIQALLDMKAALIELTHVYDSMRGKA